MLDFPTFKLHSFIFLSLEMASLVNKPETRVTKPTLLKKILRFIFNDFGKQYNKKSESNDFN